MLRMVKGFMFTQRKRGNLTILFNERIKPANARESQADANEY